MSSFQAVGGENDPGGGQGGKLGTEGELANIPELRSLQRGSQSLVHQLHKP